MQSLVHTYSLAIVFLVTGCYSTVILDSETVEQSNDKDIAVTTTEKDLYRFDAKMYRVVRDSKGQRSIQGSGKLYLSGTTQIRNFQGDIPFSAVVRVVTFEIAPLNTAIALVGATFVTWLIVYLSTSDFSFG